jgi:hypothetical protein
VLTSRSGAGNAFPPDSHVLAQTMKIAHLGICHLSTSGALGQAKHTTQKQTRATTTVTRLLMRRPCRGRQLVESM